MSAALRAVRRLGRDRALVRVVASFGLFSITEYAVWIGVLIYAYERGGTTTAGLVTFAELVPAALVAPFVAAAADRHSPTQVLLAGYLAQCAGVGAIAVTVYGDAPSYVVYAAAIAASTAVSATRPSIAAVMPALARDADGLTAANAVQGWLEAVCVVIAGSAVGALLALAQLGAVFAVCVVLLLFAALLVQPLHAPPLGAGGDHGTALADIRDGVAQIRGNREARALVGLLCTEFVVLGALDVLFVVIAFGVLDQSASWAGYLNTAYGVGGVALGALSALLIGRRLGPVVAAAPAVLGTSLVATAFVHNRFVVAGLLAAVGGAHAIYDVATRTLLQRSVPADMVARIFGLAEGGTMCGLAVGALLVPALVAIGGTSFAIVGIGMLLPVVVFACWRFLVHLDATARVPVVQIALLRSVPLFRDLPAPALEGVARALRRVDVDVGAVIIQEGDEGDDYYAIADGDVEVRQAGRLIRTMSRGTGIGEIALLEDCRRTATVVATTPVTLYALDRAAFLTAVNAHIPTQRTAVGIVHELAPDHDRSRSGDMRH
jgi:MFS family permease